MKRDPKKYLDDILYSADLINEFIGNMDFNEYSEDNKTRSAVERQLSIIGEAATQYKKGGNTLTNDVKIIAFRNRLVHGYDSLDDEIIWAIVKKFLPLLKNEVQELIEK